MADIESIKQGDLFSISRLQRLTGMDRRTITKRLADVHPAGERAGHGVYSLRDIGPALFAPYGYGGDGDPEKLPPADRKSWYESETKRRALQVRDRELIEADEVAETVATAFQRIAQTIFALPDQLERRAGLSPDQAETAQRTINDAMEGLADDLATLTPPEPDDAA